MASARRGFTLIELLVAAAIFSLLAAFLLPVLSGAKAQAGVSVCLSNLKQIHAAGRLYMEEHDDHFPPVYLRNGVGGSYAYTVDRDVHEEEVRRNPRALHNLLRPYLGAREVFRCPADVGMTLPQDAAQDEKGGMVPLAARRSSTPRTGMPLWERFGSSYREAAELGSSVLSLTLSDVPDTTAIFFAADGSGRWHRAHRGLWASLGVGPESRGGGDPEWRSNAVFLDGHARTVPFAAELWGPYGQFIDDCFRRQRGLPPRR